MKLSCDIVQDLLPLYEENLCKDATREAVEEHLKECHECRALLQDVTGFKEPEIPVQADVEEQAVVGSLRKVHRRWWISVASAFLVLPLLLLTINQVRCKGICFTNLDDIFVAWKYVKELEKGGYEKLASYMDYEKLHTYIKGLVLSEPDVNGKDYSTQMLEEDRPWLVSNDFYQEYLQWEDDMQNFWGNVIYNGVPGMMIPEEIWAEITAGEPEALIETTEGEFLLGNRLYVLLETKWGNFIVEQGSSLLESSTAAEFCTVLNAVPSEIFEEAYPELEKQAWEAYDYRQKHFAEAAAMDLQEFTDIVKTRYTAGLKSCEEQGITFTNTGYKASYYASESGYWMIEYGLRVKCAFGDFPIGVTICVQDGKIWNIGSISYSYNLQEMKELPDTILNALYMRYSEY